MDKTKTWALSAVPFGAKRRVGKFLGWIVKSTFLLTFFCFGKKVRDILKVISDNRIHYFRSKLLKKTWKEPRKRPCRVGKRLDSFQVPARENKTSVEQSFLFQQLEDVKWNKMVGSMTKKNTHKTVSAFYILELNLNIILISKLNGNL